MNKNVLTLMIVLIGITLSGCRKPYDEPEFKTVKNNETGFLVPLVGDSKKQKKLASYESLQNSQVSVKRVQIPHVWIQTGRWSHTGKYLPTLDLITVNRSPVTRDWTEDTGKGTSNKDEAIWLESKDSVVFSIDFGVTASILEEDAARFLYSYSSSSTLASVMDTEIRTRIQGAALQECAKHPLDQLRGEKLSILQGIKDDVIPFFAQKGITISTIAMGSGLNYKNVAIQDAIDETFIAQQQKVITLAAFNAQEDINNKLLSEAEALKQADIIRAEGEAAGIALVAKAAAEANSNPAFLELKKLEVEESRIAQWDGKYPQWYMGGGSESPQLLISPPIK